MKNFDNEHQESIVARYFQDSSLFGLREPLRKELRNKVSSIESKIHSDCLALDLKSESFVLERLKYYLYCEEKKEDLNKASNITYWALFTIIYFLLFSPFTNTSQRAMSRAGITIPIAAAIVTFSGNQKIRRLRYLNHLVGIYQVKNGANPEMGEGSFIAERSEHLAIVHLTRSQNLVVDRLNSDYGLDLLATILGDKSPTGRIFGIQVKGQDRAFKDELIPQFRLSPQEHQYFQELPFPVCILFFTMEDDRGYYKWIKSPHITNQHLRPIEPTFR